MSNPEEIIDRRTILTKFRGPTCRRCIVREDSSFVRQILGANDRISVCHIGNGSGAGTGLDRVSAEN